MHYSERSLPPETVEAVLNALAEGVVEANYAIIEQDPDAYPCCCGCGDFKLIQERAFPAETAVRNLQVQGPQGLTRTKHGNAFELACFQCAQRRREGEDDAYVDVKINDGFYSAVVQRPSKGTVDDMLKYAEPPEECDDCAVPNR